MKDANEMKRKEFEALPCREKWDDAVMANALIILPTRRVHDSHYRCMDFIAVMDEKMIRVSGCSDVIHVDGIGGFGENWLEKYGGVPKAVHPVGWSIDCLRVSGLLRIFTHGYLIKCGPSLSSFEMFSVPSPKEIERREKYENVNLVRGDAGDLQGVLETVVTDLKGPRCP